MSDATGIMPTSAYLSCEGREIHVTQWSPASGAGRDTVVAWHGLARTGRDMDWIARHLSAKGWRVVCPDTIGRGLSQWSPDPANEYCLAFYEKLAAALLDQLGIGRCMWLGTSMGGAIGLRGAAGRLRGRIERLILNDIGAEVAASAVERIRSYAGNPPAFAVRLAVRRTLACADRNLDAPSARRPRHAALRPGDGAAVRAPPERLRPVDSV
jgi:pimeloyl-ACP methyl ester carboxylesterase